MRLTNVVTPLPSPHLSAPPGAVKTTTCPRSGLRKRYARRLAMTRSANRPSQNAPGLAQWRVGSIDPEGMRYGLATSAWNARTTAMATKMVASQSTMVRHGCGIRLWARSRTLTSNRQCAPFCRQRPHLRPFIPCASMHGASSYGARLVHIDKDLVAAAATPLVLAILADGESYGYAILKRVRALSAGELQWTDGMLYPLLHRLGRLGYVTTE